MRIRTPMKLMKQGLEEYKRKNPTKHVPVIKQKTNPQNYWRKVVEKYKDKEDLTPSEESHYNYALTKI